MEVRVRYNEKDFMVEDPNGKGENFFGFQICNIIRYTNKKLVGTERLVEVPKNGVIIVPGIKINTEDREVVSKADNNSSSFLVDLQNTKIMMKEQGGKIVPLKTKSETPYFLIGADSGKRPKFFNVETMRDKIEESLKKEDNGNIKLKVKKEPLPKVNVKSVDTFMVCLENTNDGFKEGTIYKVTGYTKTGVPLLYKDGWKNPYAVQKKNLDKFRSYKGV